MSLTCPRGILSSLRLHFVVRHHRLVLLFYYDFIVIHYFFINYLIFQNLCLTLQREMLKTGLSWR